MTSTSKAALEHQRQLIARDHPNGEHLVLEAGSPTYGHAWRLYFKDPDNGGLHSFPGLDNGYLGFSKNEAYQTMRGILAGMDAATRMWGVALAKTLELQQGNSEYIGRRVQNVVDEMIPPGEF